MENKVYISKCSSYEIEEVKLAYDNIFNNSDLLDFVKPGMKIGIKVNLVSSLKPEKAATTHPSLLVELCDRLIALGAIVTVGDSPGGLFTEGVLKNLYKETGMIDLVSHGVILNYNVGQSVIDIDGYVVKKLDYTSWLLEQDAVINYSKIKSHGMLSFSGSVKNLFGCVPGILKPEYHYRYPNYDDFSDMLIDINEFTNCKLNLMDAVIGMEGNGPTQGKPKKIGLILASTSPYAIDLVATKLIGLDTKYVRTITRAIYHNKSVESIDDLDLSMPIDDYIVDDFKKILPGKDMSFKLVKGPIGKLVNKTVANILTVKPKVKKNECICCKKCYNICPAKAIDMKNNKPVINRDVCIRCFCCQEFCPVGAMKAKKNGIVKLLTKSK